METTKECDSIDIYKYKILEFVKGKNDDIDMKIVRHLYSCSGCRSNYVESRELLKDGTMENFHRLLIVESKIIHFDGSKNPFIAKSLWHSDAGLTYEEMEEENARSYNEMLTPLSDISILKSIEIEFSEDVQKHSYDFTEGTYLFSSAQKEFSGKLNNGLIKWELAKNGKNYIFGFYSQDETLEGKIFILKTGREEKLQFTRISKYLVGCEVEFDPGAQKELVNLENWQISWCEEKNSDEPETKPKRNTNGSSTSME